MKWQKDISLKAFNSFGVEAKAQYFTELKKQDDLAALVEWASSHELPLLILGGGSNLLFKQDFAGLVAKTHFLGKQCIDSDEQAWYVQAAAGENWHQFVRWTIEQGYAGLENLSLIPGTVGAAPMQNIGAYGVELVDVFHSLEAYDLKRGALKTFTRDECEFSYRDSFFKSKAYGRYVITSVVFRLPKSPIWHLDYAGVKDQLTGEPTARKISDCIINIRQSKLPDPATIGNAGSFFKNPILPQNQWQQLKDDYPQLPGWKQANAMIKTSAAWLIDQSGWKGYRQGDAGIYQHHALVLVNHADATGHELWQLAQNVITSVNDKFGIMLEPEPRVIG